MDYKKVNGSNTGSVELINTTIGPRYLAVTAVYSKTFKTYRHAHNFMLRNGYIQQQLKTND